MTYSVLIKRSAARELRELPGSDQARVAKSIDQLAQNPYFGSVLKGDLQGLRRLRVGSYRILYEVYKNELVVLVIRIGRRNMVYRRASN